MVKIFQVIAGILLICTLSAPLVSAVDPPASNAPAASGTTGQGQQEQRNIYASRVSDCGTRSNSQNKLVTPVNCLYLEEPIGGRQNYDLYVISCFNDPQRQIKKQNGCEYKLWGGEAVQAPWRGPVQAILTFDPAKQETKGFGLFYNYLNLIYQYMSGIIVGVAVLFVIIGGIQMITAAGDTTKFDAGKNRIKKAVLGMLMWFLASLILYTINPTFFAF